MEKKLFFISFLVFSVVFGAKAQTELKLFSPSEPVNAEDVNSNFIYIKGLLDNNTQLIKNSEEEVVFNSFVSGELISDRLNENISKINDLGASIPLFTKITAEEFNNVFSQARSQILDSYVSPCAGATANLTVSGTVDLAAGAVYKYNNITVNSGATLRINGNVGNWTEICVLNNIVNNGTILVRAGNDGQTTHSSGTFTKQSDLGIGELSYSITQKQGARGGDGNNSINGYGKGGEPVDGIGGGGGGGAGGRGDASRNNASMAQSGRNGNLGNGGRGGTTWDNCGYGAAGAGGGGAGGRGVCWGGVSRAGGGGGGYKGHHGKGLVLYIEGNYSGTGVINASGRNGFNGGASGQVYSGDSSVANALGGRGGAGAGGSGGKIVIRHRNPAVFNTNVNGGNPGISGYVNATTVYGTTIGATTPEAGEAGSVDIKEILK